MAEGQVNLLRSFRLKVRRDPEQNQIIRNIEADPQAMRMISNQYATRCLQKMGVQCTPKNIAAFLKRNKESFKLEDLGFTAEDSDMISVTVARNRAESSRVQPPTSEYKKQQRRLQEEIGLSVDKFAGLLAPFKHIKDRVAYAEDHHRNDTRGKKQKGQATAHEAITKSKLIEKQADVPRQRVLSNIEKQKSMKIVASMPKKRENRLSEFRKKEQSRREEAYSSWKDTMQKKPSELKLMPRLKRESILPAQQQRTVQKQEKEIVQRMGIDFSIQSLKENYIFPFNQGYSRRANLAIVQPGEHQGDKSLFFNARVFQFPFSVVKLQTQSICNLQQPIKVKFNDILGLLHEFVGKFPRQVIPCTRELRAGAIQFLEQEVQLVFQQVRHEYCARLVGLLAHLSYWVVFGKANPLEVDDVSKKQIFIMVNEIMQYFAFKIGRRREKLWLGLGQPIFILTFKILLEFIFREEYSYFFSELAANRNSPGQVALAKIFHLIESLFDPNNLLGRFVFLETADPELNQEGLKKMRLSSKNSGHDRKYLKKRIFATSPILGFLLPNPADGRTRMFLTKAEQPGPKEDKEEKEERVVLGEKGEAELGERERECRLKMFEVVLRKIQVQQSKRLGKELVLNLD